MWITILGLIAAALTTSAYVPQVIKAIKTKETGDISLGMYVTLIIGVVLWLVYAFLIWNIPLLVANGISLVISTWILILKIKYG